MRDFLSMARRSRQPSRDRSFRSPDWPTRTLTRPSPTVTNPRSTMHPRSTIHDARPFGSGRQFDRRPIPHSPLPSQGRARRVFVAFDEEVHREVALKEIRASLRHDPECRRAVRPGGGDHRKARAPWNRSGLWYRLSRGWPPLLRDAVHPRRYSRAGNRTLSLRRQLRVATPASVRWPCGNCSANSSTFVTRLPMRTAAASSTGTSSPPTSCLDRTSETLLVDWGLAKSIGRPEAVERPPEGTSAAVLGC